MVNSVWIQEAQAIDSAGQDRNISGPPKASDSILTSKLAPSPQEEVTRSAVSTGASNATAPALMVNAVGIQESQLLDPSELDPSEQDKKTSEQPKSSDSVLTANLHEASLAIQGAVQGADLNRILNQAEAGDSTAQYEMAVRYADGEGVTQNYPKAMAWFAKAAANGNADAQWKLGLGYLKGIGVQHDEGKAAEWFKAAANQGHVRAQSALSELYFNGRGVPRDYVRAYTWASIAPGPAGENNDRIKIIGSRMTAVQIEDAHRRISIWRERHTPETAELIVSRPTNPRVDASGTRGAATCGQSSETPASADLLQEPIQPSTLGGASGADAASHATPTSAQLLLPGLCRRIQRSHLRGVTRPRCLSLHIKHRNRNSPRAGINPARSYTHSEQRTERRSNHPAASLRLLPSPRMSRNRLSRQPRIQRSHLRKTARPLGLSAVKLTLWYGNRAKGPREPVQARPTPNGAGTRKPHQRIQQPAGGSASPTRTGTG